MGEPLIRPVVYRWHMALRRSSWLPQQIGLYIACWLVRANTTTVKSDTDIRYHSVSVSMSIPSATVLMMYIAENVDDVCD